MLSVPLKMKPEEEEEAYDLISVCICTKTASSSSDTDRRGALPDQRGQVPEPPVSSGPSWALLAHSGGNPKPEYEAATVGLRAGLRLLRTGRLKKQQKTAGTSYHQRCHRTKIKKRADGSRIVFPLKPLSSSKEIAEPLFHLKLAMEQLAASQTFRCILATVLAVGNFLNGCKVSWPKL